MELEEAAILGSSPPCFFTLPLEDQEIFYAVVASHLATDQDPTLCVLCTFGLLGETGSGTLRYASLA